MPAQHDRISRISASEGNATPRSDACHARDPESLRSLRTRVALSLGVAPARQVTQGLDDHRHTPPIVVSIRFWGRRLDGTSDSRTSRLERVSRELMLFKMSTGTNTPLAIRGTAAVCRELGIAAWF